MKLYTIGHSNHSLDKLIRLLEDNGVMTVVDVRSAPYSRYNAHFNKENLESALSQRTIQYAFAGKYLGGRPSDPSCYKSRTLPEEGADYLHEVDYPEVMKREWFVKGSEVFLRIGLARGWDMYPDRCFLQITGIYSFPDYLDGRTFADFAP